MYNSVHVTFQFLNLVIKLASSIKKDDIAYESFSGSKVIQYVMEIVLLACQSMNMLTGSEESY